ncbi:PHP domain-containing protein [Actinotalea fermentans]|uniref:Metal-dependent phosphoesterase n=1 Tax=Actinotalea fermentans TaxID=43671 RepID=A0A511YZR0_9CELL|nr:PHP domain-containing protein [Actinotalea fermentans]GEN80672.1 metal-dependent phosphoesterase [Actinotalea fermentans]
MRVDLHTHSRVSDGTDRPADVVAAAARAGLDVVALTDHDTTRGWAEAEAAAVRHGVALVRGAELSCRADHASVHLLAYLHDPDDAALLAEGERIRRSRVERAREMVDRIAADHPLTWDDVLAQTQPGTTVGRPHIADALVAVGLVTDRGAAFASMLATGSPYYVPYYATALLPAVRMVRAAGGVPVLAHPGAAARGRVISDDTIRAAAHAGLAGLEVDHRDHTPAQRERLSALAVELGLLVTGASDYHGAGKPNRLGEHTTSPEVLAAVVAQGRLPLVGP